MSALPTFIVIGAMKAGTSSLHHYLKAHPQVDMSHPKELDFFIEEKNYRKGEAWYKSHFDASYSARGESSSSYAKCHAFDDVPERMHAVLPKAKLIYLLRDPIERLVSHYVHNRAHGREARSFEEALSNPEASHYVYCSQYFMQLQAFLDFYPAEQVHLLETRELREQRRHALSAAFRFLGVDESFQSNAFQKKYNKSSDKRQPTWLDRYVKTTRLKSILRPLAPAFAREAYRYAFKRPVERPRLSAALQGRIREALADDVQRLRQFTGREFKHWAC